LSNARAESFDCAAATGRRPAVALARLALPQRCELCVAPSGGELICADCEASLARIDTPCPVCALPSPRGEVCGACIVRPPPFVATVAALVYTFPTDRLLQRIKYGGRIALAQWAGTTLASAVRASLARRDRRERPRRIVPLPLAASRQRERGFNQAREIGVEVARETGLPLAFPLVRIGAGPPQASLPWAQRHGNVRGAFAVRGVVRGERIALVDDVMTTGATLAEASRALVAAGAQAVECWVVARTLPHGDEGRQAPGARGSQ
jgi:ComF family protein